MELRMAQRLLLELLGLLLLLGQHNASAFTSMRTRSSTRSRLGATDNEDEGDFITRIFKRWLPDPEEMGMKRISVETAPEQFYCTKDRWAAPVESDDSNVKLFRPALAQTNFETRPLELIYDANANGWSAEDFHAAVDRRGPAVVLCRSKSGGVFGGYNPKGWVNYGEYRGSLAAFLFTWPNGDITRPNPVKLSKVGGAGLAQLDNGKGPMFGAEDLAIPLVDAQNPRKVQSKLGSYYERMPGGANSLLLRGVREDELTELLVYGGVYAEDEVIPFTDAESALT